MGGCARGAAIGQIQIHLEISRNVAPRDDQY